MTSEDGAPDEKDIDEALNEHPLSLDAVLEILSNEERRYLIEYLIDCPDDALPYEDAVEYIARQVAGHRGEQPNTEDIEVALQHHHLPKLARSGVIQYEMNRETIRYQGNDRLEKVYDRIRNLGLSE